MTDDAKLCWSVAAVAVALWAFFMLWAVEVPVVGERAHEAPQGQGEACPDRTPICARGTGTSDPRARQ